MAALPSLPARHALATVLIAAATLTLAAAAAPAAQAADPVVMAAGDVACGEPGIASPGPCSQEYTARLLEQQRASVEGLEAVLVLGDEQYPDGSLADFRQYFGTTWGRLGSILKPVPGNHEYQTSGAAGYFDYFASIGAQTGARGQGWYSFDVGSWHLVALNSSNACSPVACADGSPQEAWLAADLAATEQPCILAYWHHPLRALLSRGGGDIWQDLYDAGADLVLVGHDHTYVPPTPIDATGASDASGPRQVVVGTGGKGGTAFGVLKLTLRDGGFDWRFVGSGASDSGRAACHGSPPPPPPPPAPPPTATFTSTVSGLNVSFTDTSSGDPTAWSWDFGDGSGSAQQSPAHTYASGGSYAVRLTATNGNGSTTSEARIVTIGPPAPSPAPPAAMPMPTGALTPLRALRLSLPAPTGPFPIGVRSAFVTDAARTDRATARPRTIPLRIWYPAARPGATRARYLPPATGRVLERQAGLPAGSLDLETRAWEGAPPHRRIRGIVLLSPDAGDVAAFHTALISDVASRGYVVVAIDHPFDGAAVLRPDGTVLRGPRIPSRHVAAALRARLLDVRAVLTRLSRLVPQRRRATRIAIVGEGLGGATAAEAMRRHPRLRAGVGIDLMPRGPVAAAGLRRPFGLVLRRGAPRPPSLVRFVDHLRAGHPTLTIAVGRRGFTDLAVLASQIGLVDPALASRVERRWRIGTLRGPATGRRASARERRFMTVFLRRTIAR